MNFSYNEEQQLLKESMQRWFQDNYSFEQRRVVSESEQGFSSENWSTFAELGWLSIPFAEEFGGYGGNIIDVAAIMEEAGKALLVEPLWQTLILFGGLLQRSGGDVAAQLIPQIIEGSLLGSAALDEEGNRFDMSSVKTTATKTSDGYVVSGAKCLVPGGAAAQKYIVSAQTEDGLGLFLVERDAAGLSVVEHRLMDGQYVADLQLNDVALADAARIDAGNGADIVDSTLQDLGVALAAEALGIMQTLNLTTIEYTKTRKQFGKQLSSFQALRHRMVDCFMAAEQVKSLLYGTLCEMTDGKTSASEVRKAVYALRTLLGKYGKLVGDEAIQLHGGMGITDELSVGHYVKRLMLINLQFGNRDHFQQAFNQLAYA